MSDLSCLAIRSQRAGCACTARNGSDAMVSPMSCPTGSFPVALAAVGERQGGLDIRKATYPSNEHHPVRFGRAAEFESKNHRAGR